MDKLKTVICVLNSKYIHSSLAPWCLLAGIERWGRDDITAQVVEGTINERLDDVAQRIIERQPHIIGFCCYIWNITATIKLINLIKERLPDTVIIMGGPEVSYNADEILDRQPLIDYVISGEGEKPLALLLNAILQNSDKSSIPGLCYRNEDRIIISRPYISQEEPPSPYNDKYFDMLKGRISYLETSRGCPYSCAFCLSGRCESVRFYDLNRAKNELLMLANSGTRTVKLVDRTFNINKKRAVELFRFIIDNYGEKIPEGICFHFEIAGDLLDFETIALLKTAPAGAIQLEIGLQSFNEKTLSAIHRSTDTELLKSNIKNIVECGNIHVHIDLIAGLPYEDSASFANSFDVAYSLKPNMLQLGFLKLLHGSEMRDNPSEFPCQYDEQPPYEVSETPWLTTEDIGSMHKTEDAVERLFNSGRFCLTLDYVLESCGLTPFELFRRFGEFCADKVPQKISLDEYTKVVFSYFSRLSNIDAPVLRDVMVCDRLSTNSSGILPEVLDVKDKALKAALKELKKNPATCPIKGIKRGAALLYTQACIVYADYLDKDPVTGRYMLNKIFPT
ncbi:MAG: DUF4080 domain-containing protein [Oscillospiraceae bacterium]|nr:DUF4080 domain-containing protein [Oscillospiraceae bacterium]MDD4414130.1 DUF4080 domain-containing protein [Oscillospiraceae bacterium]